MPPKGYKTISLKALTAERLAVKAAESGIELSVFVDALIEFTKYPAKQEWIDFLIWYDAERPGEMGQ